MSAFAPVTRDHRWYSGSSGSVAVNIISRSIGGAARPGNGWLSTWYMRIGLPSVPAVEREPRAARILARAASSDGYRAATLSSTWSSDTGSRPSVSWAIKGVAAAVTAAQKTSDRMRIPLLTERQMKNSAQRAGRASLQGAMRPGEARLGAVERAAVADRPGRTLQRRSRQCATLLRKWSRFPQAQQRQSRWLRRTRHWRTE